MARTYKIRKFENGRNKSGNAFVNYSLTLPTPLADKLLESFDEETLAFEIELTAEGILYKPVTTEQVFPEKLPFKPGKRSVPAPGPEAKPAAKKAPAAKPGSGAKVPAKGKPGPKPGAKAKNAPAKPAAPKATAPGKPKAPGKAAPKAPAKAGAAPKAPAPKPKAPAAKPKASGPKAPAKPRAPRKPVAA